MRIAPARADSAAGAAGAAGEPLEQFEGSDALRGAPAEGEWHTDTCKGAILRGFTRQGAR
eukprot:15471696-Alexandrium_andersonii.AAC.1